jgi:hypothetical protein
MIIILIHLVASAIILYILFNIFIEDRANITVKNNMSASDRKFLKDYYEPMIRKINLN